MPSKRCALAKTEHEREKSATEATERRRANVMKSTCKLIGAESLVEIQIKCVKGHLQHLLLMGA